MRYIPVPDPLQVKDADIRGILTPIVENLRMIMGMGPYSTDARRAVREDASGELRRLINLIDQIKLGQIVELNTSINALRESVDALAGRMDTAESAISGLEGRMTTAEEAITDHEERIVDLEP